MTKISLQWLATNLFLIKLMFFFSWYALYIRMRSFMEITDSIFSNTRFAYNGGAGAMSLLHGKVPKLVHRSVLLINFLQYLQECWSSSKRNPSPSWRVEVLCCCWRYLCIQNEHEEHENYLCSCRHHFSSYTKMMIYSILSSNSSVKRM